ncbi:MAG: c-type cytochrome [Terriglobales bacterium]
MSQGQSSDGRQPIRLIVWALVAAVAVVVFAGAMVTQGRRARERSSLFVASNPQQGSVVFRSKGCVRCHSVNGEGGKVGPDLGRKNSRADLPQLVTAMWNHGPKMWERMRTDGVPRPSLSYDDVAQLLSYLYMSRHVDDPGDPAIGHELFQNKGCVHCHAVHGAGGKTGPDLASATGLIGPMEWTEALWNHPSRMRQSAEQQEMPWPQFQGHELRDLYAFVRQDSSNGPVLYGDPERGWQTFQLKSCAGCHSIRSAYTLEGPSFVPERQLPGTFMELGGAMVSHSPQMEKAMARQGITHPNLSAQEMTDIFAFLYSLDYVEPTGSPHVGASVFQWRGCSRCHGENAEGTARAPALRGRTYNSISLAVALWRHGQQMHAQARQLGLAWPTLAADDVGDLLAFLNLPAGDHH